MKYPVPLKDGPVEEVYALNWLASIANVIKKNDVEAFKKSFKSKGFFERKETHGWAEERKHNNTKDFIDFIFSLY